MTNDPFSKPPFDLDSVPNDDDQYRETRRSFADARDIREMILRKLEKLTDDVADVRSIVAGSSATTAGLVNNISEVRTDLASARKRYHSQFDKVHEYFQDDERALEEIRLRVTTIEKQLSFAFKTVAVLGSVAMAVLSWVFSHDISSWFK